MEKKTIKNDQFKYFRFFVQPNVRRVTFQGHFQGNHAELGVKGV